MRSPHIRRADSWNLSDVGEHKAFNCGEWVVFSALPLITGRGPRILERFNSDLYLTTTQAADLLSVHPSTVKRWCNDGDLAFDKTDGGHRRIHLTDLLELSREKDIPTFLRHFTPYEGHVWSAIGQVVEGGSFHRIHSLAMGWLDRAHMKRLSWLFYELGRHPQVPFERFVDDGIRGFMKLVGQAWRDGQLRVGEEHMMSEVLVEVLIRFRSMEGPHGDDTGLPDEGGRPVAIVGSMEGLRHGIGALAARVLLERRGWEVYFLGTDVPVEDFAAMQRSRGAELICVSFSQPATGADMRRCVRILSEFYDPTRPYALALGGDLGEVIRFDDPDLPFERIGTFGAIGDLSEALSTGFAPDPLATTTN